jgi:regulator of cell morphogenesis and NO signaling
MKQYNLIKKNHLLADVILSNHSLLALIKRFGIRLGFADATITEICNNYNLNTDFFLEIINTYHDKNYFPAKKLKSFSIQLIVNYLQSSHKFYNAEKILEIEQKIQGLEWKTPDHELNLSILKKFFNEYKDEVKAHTSQEEETVYPYAVFIEKSCTEISNIDECLLKMKNYSITNYAEEHDNIEEKLTDLKNIIIKYLPPPLNQNVLHEILNDLFDLEEDLGKHARIEEKILVPKILEMEVELRQKLRKTF